MAIYSACCDLQTRELEWCPRKAGTDENYTRLSTPKGIGAVFIAAQAAEAHADPNRKCPVSGWRSVNW